MSLVRTAVAKAAGASTPFGVWPLYLTPLACIGHRGASKAGVWGAVG